MFIVYVRGGELLLCGEQRELFIQFTGPSNMKISFHSFCPAAADCTNNFPYLPLILAAAVKETIYMYPYISNESIVAATLLTQWRIDAVERND